MVRANGGVATAEMLAPYLEPERDYSPADAESASVDEAFVLPAVVALRGDAQARALGRGGWGGGRFRVSLLSCIQ